MINTTSESLKAREKKSAFELLSGLNSMLSSVDSVEHKKSFLTPGPDHSHRFPYLALKKMCILKSRLITTAQVAA